MSDIQPDSNLEAFGRNGRTVFSGMKLETAEAGGAYQWIQLYQKWKAKQQGRQHGKKRKEKAELQGSSGEVRRSLDYRCRLKRRPGRPNNPEPRGRSVLSRIPGTRFALSAVRYQEKTRYRPDAQAGHHGPHDFFPRDSDERSPRENVLVPPLMDDAGKKLEIE